MTTCSSYSKSAWVWGLVRALEDTEIEQLVELGGRFVGWGFEVGGKSGGDAELWFGHFRGRGSFGK